jgi:hypothetical protein
MLLAHWSNSFQSVYTLVKNWRQILYWLLPQEEQSSAAAAAAAAAARPRHGSSDVRQPQGAKQKAKRVRQKAANKAAA